MVNCKLPANSRITKKTAPGAILMKMVKLSGKRNGKTES
jgi:hypothetical protein